MNGQQLTVKIPNYDIMKQRWDIELASPMLYDNKFTGIFKQSCDFKDLHCFSCSKDFKYYSNGLMFGQSDNWCQCPFCDSLKLVFG